MLNEERSHGRKSTHAKYANFSREAKVREKVKPLMRRNVQVDNRAC